MAKITAIERAKATAKERLSLLEKLRLPDLLPALPRLFRLPLFLPTS